VFRVFCLLYVVLTRTWKPRKKLRVGEEFEGSGSLVQGHSERKVQVDQIRCPGGFL